MIPESLINCLSVAECVSVRSAVLLLATLMDSVGVSKYISRFNEVALKSEIKDRNVGERHQHYEKG
jgi:hypothetical protein